MRQFMPRQWQILLFLPPSDNPSLSSQIWKSLHPRMSPYLPNCFTFVPKNCFTFPCKMPFSISAKLTIASHRTLIYLAFLMRT
jgi:hypothetical protein